MSDYTIGEGMKLKATFDRALIAGSQTGQQGHFRVWCDEYDTVPDGAILQGQEKTVAATSAGSDSTELMLTMQDSFRNALAKSTEAASGSVAGTDYGVAGDVVQNLKITLTPEQTGSGEPSPDNIRPILKRSGLTIFHGADQAESYEYELDFGQEIYGGELDLSTGILKVTRAGRVFTGNESLGSVSSGSSRYYRYTIYNGSKVIKADGCGGCSHLPNKMVLTATADDGAYVYYYTSNKYNYVNMRYNVSTYNTVAKFKAFLKVQHDAGTPVVCWWEYADTYGGLQTIQLDPLVLRQLFGRNRIWTDAGENATVSCTFSVHGLRITYDGTGTLQGEGGGVPAFDVTIDPEDLVPLNDPNDVERVEIAGIAASGTLTHVDYTDTQEREHIAIAAVAATGTLTDVHDL